MKAEFKTAPTPQSQGELVTTAEAMMQAEHAAWLTELISTSGTSARR